MSNQDRVFSVFDKQTQIKKQVNGTKALSDLVGTPEKDIPAVRIFKVSFGDRYQVHELG